MPRHLGPACPRPRMIGHLLGHYNSLPSLIALAPQAAKRAHPWGHRPSDDAFLARWLCGPWCRIRGHRLSFSRVTRRRLARWLRAYMRVPQRRAPRRRDCCHQHSACALRPTTTAPC
ncbi:hypothetical protein Ctob_005943 [Chrysochromulina tobinii]|uniref:Uncharacterized protein n=1 Tax=Chrysochromulina tobinii TaxID=1460289 RepID=A0A0M0J4D6_9EUKA|nr:hypothetical protein Ctob_005943 [Chrysochromulina tobinii]|eukprot:KOO21187.1 hypothetical protein Ctob_005943 [Chrysochromulina sp. CCMP291]